jgi:predicted DNA-binding protein
MDRPDRAATIRIPADLYERIERMARRQHRSVTSMITYMLDLAEDNWEYLAKQALVRDQEEERSQERDEDIDVPALALA